MSKEEILGGLKNAVARGQTLQQAILSFKNSGYPEAEIKAAVAEFHQSPINPTNSINSQQSNQNQQNTEQNKKPTGQPIQSKLQQQIKNAVNSPEIQKPINPNNISQQVSKNQNNHQQIHSNQATIQKSNPLKPINQKQMQARTQPNNMTIQRVSNYGTQQNQQTSQTANQQNQSSHEKNFRISLPLVILLIMLFLALLSAGIIFREEIFKWLENLF